MLFMMRLGRGWMMKVYNTLIRRAGCAVKQGGNTLGVPLPDNDVEIFQRVYMTNIWYNIWYNIL